LNSDDWLYIDEYVFYILDLDISMTWGSEFIKYFARIILFIPAGHYLFRIHDLLEEIDWLYM